MSLALYKLNFMELFKAYRIINKLDVLFFTFIQYFDFTKVRIRMLTYIVTIYLHKLYKKNEITEEFKYILFTWKAYIHLVAFAVAEIRISSAYADAYRNASHDAQQQEKEQQVGLDVPSDALTTCLVAMATRLRVRVELVIPFLIHVRMSSI